jgi:hypothetical protein
MSKIKKCRSCNSNKLQKLFSLGNQSFTGIFPKNKNQKVPRGKLILIICSRCKLVQLSENFNLKKMYGNNYGYRTGLNLSMVNHIKDKINFLKNKFRIVKDDIVIDIGANDGTLLSFLDSKKNKLIAVDPTIKKFNKFYKKNIIKVPNFFSFRSVEKYLKNRKVKLITSIAMFYDLPDPVFFAKQIYKTLADEGVWHFEQSYSGYMLKNLSYDTICHEHLEYYSLYSIKKILDSANLKIIDISFNNINGGSFALTVAKKNSKYLENKNIYKILRDEKNKKINSVYIYKQFYKRINREKDKMINFFKKIKSQQKTVIGYGASTKGNVLLQYCNISSKNIKYICDVNKDKYGCYTPGTKIKIISEKKAKQLKPDFFFVLPWHFKNFILNKEKKTISSGTKFIFPLPKFQVI